VANLYASSSAEETRLLHDPEYPVTWLEPRRYHTENKTITILQQIPLTLSVALREEPPGILRVGNSRVLLELVIHAYQQGETPEEIVEMYDTLELADVFAVIAYYLANRAEVDEYLLQCDEEADALRRRIEVSQRPGPTKEDLLERAKAI
jgi:uncharacterized protein (DUF433 family)